MSDPLAGREIIVEVVDAAGLRRVNVIDAASGEETFAAGPASAPVADLQRLALRKLAKRLGLCEPADSAASHVSLRPGRRI